MTKHLILILTIFLLFQGCNIKNKFSINETKIVIPDSIYSFFPKQDTLCLQSYSIGTNAEENMSIGKLDFFLDSYFFKIYSPCCESDHIFESQIKKYKLNAIDYILPMDSSYFIILYEDDILKMYDSKTLSNKYKNSVNKYMLPSFHKIIKDLYGVNHNTVCGLPDDYKILIMKSGRNFILPENRKFNWSILPPTLKHGYTSGIAYRSRNDMIIYWCVAW